MRVPVKAAVMGRTAPWSALAATSSTAHPSMVPAFAKKVPFFTTPPPHQASPPGGGPNIGIPATNSNVTAVFTIKVGGV